MFSIGLEGIRVYAYHGFYPEEQVLGTYFLVDIRVEFAEEKYRREDLATSVNYEILHRIILEHMQAKPHLVLETLAQDMLTAVQKQFPFIHSSFVKIRKLHPPLSGTIGASVVELTR